MLGYRGCWRPLSADASDGASPVAEAHRLPASLDLSVLEEMVAVELPTGVLRFLETDIRLLGYHCVCIWPCLVEKSAKTSPLSGSHSHLYRARGCRSTFISRRPEDPGCRHELRVARLCTRFWLASDLLVKYQGYRPRIEIATDLHARPPKACTGEIAQQTGRRRAHSAILRSQSIHLQRVSKSESIPGMTFSILTLWVCLLLLLSSTKLAGLISAHCLIRCQH